MSYIIARERPIRIKDMNNVYRHNERKNKNYLNEDINLSINNYHFKKPSGTYKETFEEMIEQGLFSTRKIPMNLSDTVIASEIIVAVSKGELESKEAAIEFFKIANQFLNEYFTVTLSDGTTVSGKDICISSVLHCDEGSYGLHYTTACCVPTTIKKRRTKSEIQQGIQAKAIKEIVQLSHSKFWQSEKDENGKLQYSYSKLQDAIYEYYKHHGYADIERGVKGSTAQNLHPNQYKKIMEEINTKLESMIGNIEGTRLGSKYIINSDEIEIINAAVTKAQQVIHISEKLEQSIYEEKRMQSEILANKRRRVISYETLFSQNERLNQENFILKEKITSLENDLSDTKLLLAKMQSKYTQIIQYLKRIIQTAIDYVFDNQNKQKEKALIDAIDNPKSIIDIIEK